MGPESGKGRRLVLDFVSNSCFVSWMSREFGCRRFPTCFYCFPLVLLLMLQPHRECTLAVRFGFLLILNAEKGHHDRLNRPVVVTSVSSFPSRDVAALSRKLHSIHNRHEQWRTRVDLESDVVFASNLVDYFNLIPHTIFNSFLSSFTKLFEWEGRVSQVSVHF